MITVINCYGNYPLGTRILGLIRVLVHADTIKSQSISCNHWNVLQYTWYVTALRVTLVYKNAWMLNLLFSNKCTWTWQNPIRAHCEQRQLKPAPFCYVDSQKKKKNIYIYIYTSITWLCQTLKWMVKLVCIYAVHIFWGFGDFSVSLLFECNVCIWNVGYLVLFF